MGSYISIYNNTSDTYMVKVGTDEAALKISGISISVIAAIATIVATSGAAAPFFATLVANGVVEVLGLSTASLAAMTALAASVAGISIPSTVAGWAMSAAVFLSKNLGDKGYTEIEPGQKKSFGKYSLSLWQQAECVRVRVNPDNKEEVLQDKVMMRPIFSGPTVDSTLEHNIAYWVQKWGHEGGTVLRLSEDSRKAISGNVSTRAASDTDWLKVASEARVKAKEEELKKAGINEDEAAKVTQTVTAEA